MPRDPMDVVVRNLFTIQRLGNSVNDEVRARINELFDEIVAAIARIDPTGPSLQRWREYRRDQLFDQIQELTADTFDEVYRNLRIRLAHVGREQSGVAVQHLQAILGAGNAGEVEVVRVTVNQLKAIIDSQPFEGAVLKTWAERQSERTVFEVRRQIQLGMTRAETIDDMVRRVRGRSVGRGMYTGGVLQSTTRQAEAIVRTGVNFVSNEAAMETFKQNRDITTTYTYTATIDSRTTLICASLDGSVHEYDDPSAPKPPQHWNCRSIVVPNVDWGSLGLDEPPTGTRASAEGQISAETTYAEWLRGQPASVQDEILGPSRGRLFREDRMTLREMVRSDGRRIPLDELRDAA